MRDAVHRRQHYCAIIEDLACSGFNLHLAAFCSWVERWDDGGESCAVLLCCAAAAVRVACVCFHRGHQKRCFIARKCSRILPINKKYVLGQKSAQVLILGKAIYHAGRYV